MLISTSYYLFPFLFNSCFKIETSCINKVIRLFCSVSIIVNSKVLNNKIPSIIPITKFEVVSNPIIRVKILIKSGNNPTNNTSKAENSQKIEKLI